jgi:hypothetical protein
VLDDSERGLLAVGERLADGAELRVDLLAVGVDLGADLAERPPVAG